MPEYMIEGRSISAPSRQHALRIFTSSLKVVEVPSQFSGLLGSLKLPEWVKRGIQEERAEDKLEQSFCVIYTTSDREVWIQTFSSKDIMEQTLVEHFEKPDGSSWSVFCVLQNGELFEVKPTVTLAYVPIAFEE